MTTTTAGSAGVSPEVDARLAAMPHLGGGGRLRLFLRSYGWRIGVVLEFFVFLFAWWFFTAVAPILPASFLPVPAAVWDDLVILFESGQVYDNTLFTVQNFFIGFLLAAVVSIPAGILLGSSRLIELFVAPPIWAAYAVPRIALAPLFILIFGLGAPSKIAIVFLMAAFPIVINTMQGVKEVNPSLLRVGMVYGASRWEAARTIVLPSALPYILAGVRLGAAGAIAGALIGEFVGSFEGLGLLLARAAFNFEVSRALALVAIVVVLAQLLMSLVQLLKKKAAPWDDSEWS
jgi:NitT/TauT family transport system permease protein